MARLYEIDGNPLDARGVPITVGSTIVWKPAAGHASMRAGTVTRIERKPKPGWPEKWDVKVLRVYVTTLADHPVKLSIDNPQRALVITGLPEVPA